MGFIVCLHMEMWHFHSLVEVAVVRIRWVNKSIMFLCTLPAYCPKYNLNEAWKMLNEWLSIYLWITIITQFIKHYNTKMKFTSRSKAFKLIFTNFSNKLKFFHGMISYWNVYVYSNVVVGGIDVSVDTCSPFNESNNIKLYG